VALGWGVIRNAPHCLRTLALFQREREPTNR
jgi:hypothetical protein